ncbi:MAG: helix-turn-helix transcriptional regulator [Candidatus Competibacterales bacterium]
MTTQDISLFDITQVTTATFTDLYIERTFFSFIVSGSKRVLFPTGGELVGEERDLLIFAPGAMVTMENRPIINQQYRAVGVSVSDALIEAVFPETPVTSGIKSTQMIQLIRAKPSEPARLLPLLRETLNRADLPTCIRWHRLMEPLVWLRHEGYTLLTKTADQPLGKVRRILQTDLGRSWRAAEVAAQLAMSEATMRRVLARSGQGFAKILLHTRLERGLERLQTTYDPISEIALDVGFKTPSHFADAFKQRFGISPRQIRTTED